MKIAFGEVLLGERFTTHYSKRRITCVKIAPTKVDDVAHRNAVILLDHCDAPADDLGALIVHNDKTEVEVTR